MQQLINLASFLFSFLIPRQGQERLSKMGMAYCIDKRSILLRPRHYSVFRNRNQQQEIASSDTVESKGRQIIQQGPSKCFKLNGNQRRMIDIGKIQDLAFLQKVRKCMVFCALHTMFAKMILSKKILFLIKIYMGIKRRRILC